MRAMSSSLAWVVDVGNERFYAAPADVVFDALVASASRLFKVGQVDRNSRSVTLTTGVSAFSWGANMLAQVVPMAGGAHVRVAGSSTISMNFTAKGRESNNTVLLLDAISTDLSGRPVAAAGWFPDPGGSSRQRYWDGHQWTDHYWPEG
jgi:hypothetical protein